jgi:hypothetical protein
MIFFYASQSKIPGSLAGAHIVIKSRCQNLKITILICNTQALVLYLNSSAIDYIIKRDRLSLNNKIGYKFLVPILIYGPVIIIRHDASPRRSFLTADNACQISSQRPNMAISYLFD